MNKLAIAIVGLVLIGGCTQHTVKPEPIPTYRVELRMSPALHEAVMTLVYMKSDPNVFKIREPDPFRRMK